MSVIFPNSASLTLRESGAGPWTGTGGITQKGQPLTYSEMDQNWWALDSASIGLLELSLGAAYTGSENKFTGSQTFGDGFISEGPSTLVGPTEFFGETIAKSGFTVTGSVNVLNNIAALSISASLVSGTFVGDGGGLTNLPAAGTPTASFDTFTASYYVDSASSAQRITSLYTGSTINSANIANLGVYTASLNNWTSSAYTGSVEGFLSTSSFQVFSGSVVTNYATKTGVTASIADITLQQVTTQGNSTSASITISGSLEVTGSTIITGSLQLTSTSLLLVFNNLPVSPAGLPPGAIWNNGGVLQVI